VWGPSDVEVDLPGAYTIVVDPTSAQTGSVFVSVTAT
jgi:hypothetical protein